MQSRLTNLSLLTNRPKTAIGYHRSHQTQHRLDDNECLNSIKNEICKVFQQQKKPIKQIKDLTAKVDPAFSHRINRMCVQYSICPNPKRQKRLSENIDVQFIARNYVKAKSRDKKKEEERNMLVKSVAETSRRYLPAEPQQFFKFDHQALRKMQIKASKNKNNSKEHPYIALYQQSQQEVMAHLSERNSLNLDLLNKYPNFAEAEEWQKQRKQIKQIYRGLKQFRSSTQRYGQKKREVLDSFYIT